MIAIDITDARPADVLLTSGDAKFSSVNKLCQSIVRGGRVAPYSHASFLLSPFLVAESLDQSGVVLTDLFQPGGNPHGRENSLISRESYVVCRSHERRIRLFAVLPGVDAAAIYRYAPMDEIETSRILMLLPRLLSALESVYLVQYPAYIRLVRTAGIIADDVLTLLEKVGRVMERKGITGPFCSELVVLLLAAVDSEILNQFGSAEKAAPSDIHHSNLFIPIAKGASIAALEGGEVEEVANFLSKNLRPSGLESQDSWAKILQLGPGMEAVGRALGRDWKEYFDKARKALQADSLSSVRDSIFDSIFVSNWLKYANECAETCPQRRTESVMRSTFPFGLPRQKQTDEACADIRYCSSLSRPDWHSLTRTIRERRDERLKTAVELQSEMIRGWHRTATPDS